MKKVTLKGFIVGNSDPTEFLPGCSNFGDSSYCKEDQCIILKGKRCAYFERAVLPVSKQGGRDYIYDEYNETVKANISGVNITTRMCGCGKPLTGKRQYCEKCRKKRLADNQRRWRRSKM